MELSSPNVMSFIKIKGEQKVPILMFLGGFLAIPFAALLSVATSDWLSELFSYLIFVSIAVTVLGLVLFCVREIRRTRASSDRSAGGRS